MQELNKKIKLFGRISDPKPIFKNGVLQSFSYKFSRTDTEYRVIFKSLKQVAYAKHVQDVFDGITVYGYLKQGTISAIKVKGLIKKNTMTKLRKASIFKEQRVVFDTTEQPISSGKGFNNTLMNTGLTKALKKRCKK